METTRIRIAFILIGNERRNGPVNGDTLRRDDVDGGVAASGTDQTTILVAEHLASCCDGAKYDCTIASSNSGEPGARIRGVTYTDLSFGGVEDRTYDVLVNTLWFEDFEALPIDVTRAVVSWAHCPYIYGFDPLKRFLAGKNPKLKYAVVNLSEWGRSHTTHIARALSPDVVERVIPNPLMTDVIDRAFQVKSLAERDEQRAPRDVVFHATWNRGGKLVIDTMRTLGWREGGAKLHMCDYLMHRPDGSDSSVEVVALGALSKSSLLETLSRCQYFVYPLVNEAGQMHKDTFACVVAEACAMGAVVLTYPVAALPETYGDALYWLPFPEKVLSHHEKVEHLRTATLSDNVDMLDVENIVAAMRHLDEHPDERKELRDRARARVTELYDVARVGRMWEELIEALLQSSP